MGHCDGKSLFCHLSAGLSHGNTNSKSLIKQPASSFDHSLRTQVMLDDFGTNGDTVYQVLYSAFCFFTIPQIIF